ncbi:hypothetical protein [Thalassoroseus pseudoceratinae]|uniref:hypothetical protein n=1 Tax=Thalassoroseus pseudoceratinae TaxID=2713176 RepID=UPI001421E100|nr:hypothetical protein [Thalassoroseus pseudoceratinae]
MITFQTYIKKKKPADIMQREFNALVREALIEAAEFWIKEFLPLHFESSAVRRYGYAARKSYYNKLKRRARMILKPGTAQQYVPAPKPPGPLVYTGELKKEVLSRPVSAFKIKATATGKKQKVRVPVRIPHPINPKNSGELTKLVNEELKMMHRVATEALKERLAKWQAESREQISA